MSIGLIVLALAFVFFLVVAFFAAKTWHAGHVVALAFLFLFSLLFLFMAATLMRTHNEYRPKYANALRNYENAVKQEADLTFGTPSEPAGEGTLMGERRLAQVQQATSARSWGNVFPQVTQQGINLDMRGWTNDGCQQVGQEEENFDDPIEPEPDPEASGDPADGGGDAALADGGGHGILQDQYVYAFHEFPVKNLMSEAEKNYYFGIGSLNGKEFTDADTKGSCRVPGAYLGKYLVTNATPNRLTVQPAGRLTQTQLALIKDKPRWMLFERLPTDSHEIFAGAEDNMIGQMMTPAWFAQRKIPVPGPAYSRIIAEYQQDGKPVDATNSMRTTQRIEFTSEYSKDVNLDVADLPDTDVPFSTDGRAQVKSLMHKGEDGTPGPATFAVGDQVTVDGEMAKFLINQERVAKPAEDKPRYARQLRDYQFLLNTFQTKFNDVATARNTVEAQVADLDASLKRLRDQIDKHEKELALLDKDKKGFAIEAEQLQAFKKILVQRMEILRGEVQSRSFATR